MASRVKRKTKKKGEGKMLDLAVYLMVVVFAIGAVVAMAQEWRKLGKNTKRKGGYR